MKHVVDGERAATDRSANQLDSAVRDASGMQTLDPLTEEIEVEPAEPSAPLRTEPVPVPPPVARRTSLPPPPPAEALRGRASVPASLATPPPPPPGPRPPIPEAAQLQAEIERMSKRMRERDAYVAELEELYAQRTNALRKAQGEIDALQQRVSELEAQLTAAPPPLASDDLTQIRGIGPRFAKALQALGSGSFAAIAAWTAEDVAEIGRRLKVAPGRIERDRWIEQARDQLAGKSARDL